MARMLRLEYPGALYHIINRGNYRSDIFANEKTREAFEVCLFEACVKSAWILHDFVVMRNHYHLALKTPEANLVVGMQWLQATFASRFNHFRKEAGHLFQGRYKALVIEDGDSLAEVCRYIHLNPVRAGAATVPGLRDYRNSSYWYLWRPKLRPEFLRPQSVLVQSAALRDNLQGWISYEEDLAKHAAADPAGHGRTYISLSHGWCLGSKAFRGELIQRHGVKANSRALGGVGATEVKAQEWERLTLKALGLLTKCEDDLSRGPKSARWRVALAVFLKERTQASSPWLANRLKVGRPAYLRRLVSAARRGDPSPELGLLRVQCTT
jgi:REP element-mobilizing transposase RayT